MSSQRPFARNPRLTAIALTYVNADLIADQVMPRVRVPTEQFKYTEHSKEHFDTSDDLVGRAGRTNELEFTSAQQDSSTVDHGLEAPVPQSDIDAAAAEGANYDPLSNATLKLRKRVGLNRETRVAGMVFNAANYDTGNKVQLSGTDQWTDQANSDPISDILTAKETPLAAPNVLVLGTSSWRALRTHPQIAKAIHGNSGDTDIVARAQIAALFELDRVIVGDARRNTAARGLTPSFGRIWEGHAALLHVDPNPTDMDEITWGLTAVWGEYFVGDRPDPDIGLRGGRRVRVGESVRELVVASGAGYFIEDAVP